LLTYFVLLVDSLWIFRFVIDFSHIYTA